MEMVTPSHRAPLWNLKLCLFTGDFDWDEGGLWKRSVPLYWCSVREPACSAPFSFTKYVKDVSGNGHVSLLAPWGTVWGPAFPGTFEKGVIFLS
jgi:hypothetical protein